LKLQFIGHIFVADILRPMFIQTRIVSSESHNIFMYVKHTVR